MPTPPWAARIWAEYRAHNLTPLFRDVLLTLHTYRGAGGVAWPSHETLADRGRCSVSTVQRALAHARKLGLLEWCARRRRAAWRSLRTSNLYRFLAPTAPVQPGQRPVFWRPFRTTGQNERGGEKSKKESLLTMLQEAAGLPDLLANRRREVEQRLLTGLPGRPGAA